MITLNGDQTIGETARRKLLFKIAASFIAACLLLVTAFLLWLTQPLFYVSPRSEKFANQENLQNHVRMLSETLAPRGENLTANLNKKAAFIKAEFEKTGARISEQIYTVNNAEYRNVIAVFNSDAPEKIIVGAHYDTAGGHAGADDNSSGIAGLLELARLLAKTQSKLHIELVAFSTEEPPFFGTPKMGSYFHAQNLRENGAKVRLMICLEMIGFFTDASDSQNYPISFLNLIYGSKGDFITVVGNFGNGLTTRSVKAEMQRSTATPIYSINAPSFVSGVDFSDHRNYWQFGFDAVMITDTAFYLNKNYHTHADTWEKLDYNRMAGVVDATFAAVISMN